MPLISAIVSALQSLGPPPSDESAVLTPIGSTFGSAGNLSSLGNTDLEAKAAAEESGVMDEEGGSGGATEPGFVVTNFTRYLLKLWFPSRGKKRVIFSIFQIIICINNE